MRPKSSGLLLLATIFIVINPLFSNADTFIVTSRDDSGPGTLREAIDAANITTGQHLITFNISGPGSNSITVNTPLIVSNQMTINGAGTQVINGQGTTTFALAAGSNGSELRGLAIIASTQGVLIQSDNCRLAGCRIGVDWADNTTNGNQYGVMVTGNDNWIGGNTVPDRNLISSQRYYGIHAVGAQRLKIQGNYVGTNSTGMSSVRNRDHGVLLENSTSQCLIGGNRSLGEGNLISGNGNRGIFIRLSSTGNTVCGNIIGLSIDQSTIVGNVVGISVDSDGNRVGIPALGFENIISGNDQGISVFSSNNTVQNNIVGLNSNGDVKYNSEGIRVYGYRNTVGGSRNNGKYESNVCSGNGFGIYVQYDGNTVCGNYVGTDRTGTLSRGNDKGIVILGSHNVIGGDQQEFGNVISGNTDYGFYQGNGTGNVIIGNLIGLTANGDVALPNGRGLYIDGGTDCIVGDVFPARRNVISGNGLWGGVYISYATRIILRGNYIGTDITGLNPIKNNFVDMAIYNAYGCLIGGTTAEEKNLICGDAVGISITAASGNTIVGNWMGVLANGNMSSEHFQTAVYLDADAHDNYIGLQGSGQGNLIAAAGVGIHAVGAGTTANAFYGNTICASTITPILLESDANLNQQPPVITYAYSGDFQGRASPGDYIEVFKADRDDTRYGGSLRYLGAATANAQGMWFVNGTNLLGGEYMTAISTDSNNNSSSFALNFRDHGPTPTPTPFAGLAAVDLKGRIALPYPNPAKDQVNFLLHLDQPGEVKINIYNLSGERVASVQEDLAAGRGQVITWMCESLAPGIYFARVSIKGQKAETFKIAILNK